MKFVKKPIVIEAVQIWANSDWPHGVTFTEANGFEVFNELHNTWIKFSVGDWINVTDPKDLYPIQAEVMKRTYDPVA